MPSNIRGLKGSCLLIPCTFDYYYNPPRRPDRVAWYQYASYSYPLVCKDWDMRDEIDEFKGKTWTPNSGSGRNCDLLIKPVTQHHHRQKIYPWVDPDYTGKYTHAFWDKTVTIEVVDRAEAPRITIYGDRKVGQSVTVQCTASHTCSIYPPDLSLNIPLRSHSLTHSSGSGGTTETTLTTTLNIERDHQTVQCSVRHMGGHTVTATQTLNAECSFSALTISRTSNEFLEGQASKVTSTASYTCSKHIPTLTWNYGSMPASTDTSNSGSTSWRTVSTLTFTASANDHGMSHNQDRLYPWMDKHPITSYQSLGPTFYEKTSQLIVSDQAQEPQVSIIGIPRVGEESTVSCNVRHTCISAPPTLTISGIPGEDLITDTLVTDGIWERTVERTWAVKEEDQSVKCTVSYSGGQRETSEIKLNVECPYNSITMTERPGNATEGVAKSVICSVSYKCKKNKPTIVWNYEDIQSSLKTKENSSNTFITVSNLTFIGSLEDDGKSLTCTAQFVTGETSDSETLHIKKYVRDPYENDTFNDQAADVPFRFSALTGSCVVIPCSIPYKEDEPFTRGVWSKRNNDIIYHNGPTFVVDHFKGRTRMLGELNEGNCSLEIDDIKPFDNGPFCFHAERDNKDRYRFNNSCVFIVMKASPEKPVMTSVPAEVDAGSMITVSCSVTHTCPSHPPVFSWSVSPLTSEVTHTWTPQGIWETTSNITFTAAGGDGVKNLTCTAISWLGKQRASTVQMTVKG
ncbi:uncharacterized protein LOC120561937 [Perca fluviatilis]|uniref:uncharacterized protein LOC120561937 n=1 Tax=Perca fluviatilis TaxID=8168 RepID=UPI001962ED2C|nr:uncharacterized protein LOC120561937 [Perca fluviatilis]